METDTTDIPFAGKQPPLATRTMARKIAKGLPIQSMDVLTKDLRASAASLNLHEIRFLVDEYYMIQENRKTAGNQILAMTKADEPAQLIAWLFNQMDGHENEIKKWLGIYCENEPTGVGKWLMSQVGVGPVIAAGLLAHIDIEKAPTVGHIWSFAGLVPGVKWEKGQKRPWNAALKTLAAFKLGDSIVKTCNLPKSFYGPLYSKRKQQEVDRSEKGFFAAEAARALSEKKYGKDTDAYKAYVEGKLPPAHLHARARRWTVKLFLAGLQTVMYFQRYGTMPPLPYVFEHLEGHSDYIGIPNADLIPGLEQGLREAVEQIRTRPRKFPSVDAIQFEE